MTTDSLNDWSTTPASNTNIAGTDISVGCPPADVGVFMRTAMSQIAYAVQGSGGSIPATWFTTALNANSWTPIAGTPHIFGNLQLRMTSGANVSFQDNAGTNVGGVGYEPITGTSRLWATSDGSNAIELDVNGMLTVTGSTNQTVANFGFLNNSTPTGIFGGSQSQPISLQATQIISAVQFSATSDGRLKDAIATITPEEGAEWVSKSRPVRFTMNGTRSTGFIAQEQMKAGYAIGVAWEKSTDSRLAETVDADGFHSPHETKLTLAYETRIAFLTAALQDAFARIERLEGLLRS